MVAESIIRVLRSQPDVVVVGRAESIADAIDLVADTRPDVALVDYRLPDGDGAVATARVVAESPETRVLILTAADDDAAIAATIRAGASGFLTRDRTDSDLMSAMRTVGAGGAYLPAAALRTLDGPSRRVGADLTRRERQVLELMARGLSTRAIAERLTVSPYTARNHVHRILTKLAPHSKVEAVAIAAREGLMELPRRRR